MKRILLIVAAFIVLTSTAFAAESCYWSNGPAPGYGDDKKEIELTCTGDGSITAFSIIPKNYNVRGYFLYSVTTDPGTSAPTADYDITLMVDGEDIAGGLLADRSATNTETVLIAPTTKGYPIMGDSAMAVTFANNTANPSTIVIRFKFVKN
jgi:hypothetical protein